MEGFSILNARSFLIPYLPRYALVLIIGGIWIVLLLHVQESGQKLITILPYARIGRYGLVQASSTINCMGILIEPTHLERVLLCFILLADFDSNYNVAKV